MPRFVWKLLGVLILIVLIGAPLALAVQYQLQTRNFRAVREGVLYRSGQMTQGGLKRVVNDYGIRTVVSLRDSYVPGRPPPDRDEEQFCRKLGLNYHRITPRHWEGRKGEPAPVEVNVKQFLDILSDTTNYPVLVHCFGGVHRAGAYSALYRMEFEGWSNEQAIEEMKATGYTNLDEHRDILGFMEKYQPTRRQALNGSAPHR
jgi:protein tyrosine/serine phosphatase